MLNEISFDQVIHTHAHKNYMSSKCRTFLNYKNGRMDRQKKMHIRYKAVNKIFSLFRRNSPLSVVKFYDEKYYAVVQKEQERLGDIQLYFNIQR